MSDRTIIVTGANRGLGLRTAERLLRAGARVIITSRDSVKGERAAKELSAIAPGRVESRALDVASLASIAAFGEAFEREGRALDGLLHNAGVMQQSRVRRTTVDGFEETLGTNAIGPFALTHGLWPSLRRASAPRVVFVSSRLHLPDSRGTPVRFDFDDPHMEREYDPDRAYKNSKLAVLWVAYELARRAKEQGAGVCANGACPGFVPFTAAESTKGVFKLFMRYVMPLAPFAVSPEAAADALSWTLLDPSIEGRSGRFFAEKHEIDSSPESHDEAKARRFCEMALAWTKLAQWP